MSAFEQWYAENISDSRSLYPDLFRDCWDAANKALEEKLKANNGAMGPCDHGLDRNGAVLVCRNCGASIGHC